MSDSAELYPLHFGEVLNALPEYEEYLNPESAYRGEAPFRMALGNHIKDWGERLLDLSEFQGNLLPRRDHRVIDHLVSMITDLFRTLNCGGTIRKSVQNEGLAGELRSCDARILRLIEDCSGILDGMHRGEWAGEWIEHDSRLFYRKLRRLQRELRDRNLLLGLRAHAVVSTDEAELELF